MRLKFDFKKLLISPSDETWKKIMKIAFYVFLGIFLFVAGMFAYFAKDLPSSTFVSKRVVTESTKIFDRSGDHLLYEIHGEEKRTIIDLKEMPESIRFATIVLEDQGFYSHHGVKLTSIIRAALKDILHRQVAQGGSTITQQFVKNSLLSKEKTFTRKIKELILSLELEQKFSKDEILAMYLNEIPYGSNAYGIEAASQTYFGKPTRELTLDESTLLASLPKAPSYYSPYGSHPEDLKSRQEFTLNKMADLGYINRDEAEAAKRSDVLSKIKPFQENISAPHFVMYIKEHLESNYGKELIERGGLKVFTTLDWNKQQSAETAVREGALSNEKKYRAENASLVAIDPKSGQILAMVGSRDYFDKNIDGQVNVAIRERQPGSSFKPYVYLTAFKKGFSPETNIWDLDTEFDLGSGQKYNPKNYDNKNRGLLQMKDALAMSLNVPAVKTLYLAGVRSSVATAKEMGIGTLNYPDRYGLSLVLGGGEVKLLDHTGAFGVLATGGIRHEKTGILRIVDKDGAILEKYSENAGERVEEEKYVAMIDYILSTNDLRAAVFGNDNPLKFDDRPVAAKTGTTNEWRDGWTVGYTPSLVVGVWAGNNDNSPMAQGADGIYVAAPIWRNFMNEVLKNYPVEQFPKYEKEDTGKPVLDGKLESSEEIKVCEIPGKDDEYCLASDSCPDKKVEKKEFFAAHSILWYVDKNDPRGDNPKNPESDPQFKNWEKAVQEWAKKEKLSTDEAPDKKCDASDFEKYKPSIEIVSPSDNENIDSSPFKIKVKGSADYGTKKVTLYVDGDKVATKDSSSFEYSYAVPDGKKNDVLEVKVTIEDDAGNESSDAIKVKCEIVI